MNFDVVTAIGAAASVASIASFAPQAWKIIQTRDTSSISAWAYVLTVSGFALWMAYGALLGQWPLIVANATCFGFSAFILLMKLLPAQKKNDVADAIDPEA